MSNKMKAIVKFTIISLLVTAASLSVLYAQGRRAQPQQPPPGETKDVLGALRWRYIGPVGNRTGCRSHFAFSNLTGDVFVVEKYAAGRQLQVHPGKEPGIRLLIGEVDEIRFVVYLEVQFNSPLFCPKTMSS